MHLKIGSKEFTTQQTIFLAVIVVIVLALILISVGVLPGGKGKNETANIVVWGIDDDTRLWKTTIGRFRDSHPDVDVSYVSVDEANYESELLNTLAAGSGPDVFMFHSKWLLEHSDKVAPAPSKKITTVSFSGLFPQVVEQDFVSNERIYAMPLFADTLALLYNRDIFDKSGVVFPPGTWGEFDSVVAKVRTFENGVITNKAASIGGTSKSVSNAIDLLGLMMMQEGSAMVNESFTRADFGKEGETALGRYTKFANPQDPLFTWQDSFDVSNRSFADEDVGMIFGYPKDVREIKELNPFLNFGISKMPQINEDSPTNFANYWGFAVASSTSDINAAWDFVIFATTDRATAEDYSTKTGHAPALRFLISKYLKSAEVGIFAEQALTARSWPQVDDDAVDIIFNDMISEVVSGEVTIGKAVSNARGKLTELIRR